jgi:hypothetical protein
MSAKVLQESVITFAEAAAIMPMPTSVVSVGRWARRGCKGIRLESARVGGRTVTSREAVQRFLAALNGEPAEAEAAPAVPA